MIGSELREYARGTSITVRYPWGLFVRARVLCSDGIVRATKRLAETADTFFSVPAAVSVRGRTVSGYLTISTLSGSDVETPGDPAAALFVAYAYGKNGDALPPGKYREPLLPSWSELVSRPVLSVGWGWDLRVDTGDFRLWTARTGLADGEPFERTVYVESYDGDRWSDLGHYDGDDPPRGLPGVTAHAFRGELS